MNGPGFIFLGTIMEKVVFAAITESWFAHTQSSIFVSSELTLVHIASGLLKDMKAVESSAKCIRFSWVQFRISFI